MDATLLELRRLVRQRAAVIEAPESLLPTYVTSDQSGRPHIEREGDELCYVVSERGQEQERRRTREKDELLYWVFRGVTFSMATSWEVAHRQPDEDFRRGLFARQLELLERLEPDWAQRYRLEKAARLREVGLA